MGDHGFYVTLPCNASLSVYPENRISSYTTRLAKTINLKGEWQVGLVEIEYPRSWYTFKDNNVFFTINTAPAPPQKHASIPGEEVFNELSRIYIVRDLHVNGGYYDNVSAVISSINNVLEPDALLTYDQLINKVQVAAKPNISVTFFEKLSAILGTDPNVPLGRSAYRANADFTRSLITNAPHQADINGGFYMMYVYTDIIEYQSVGDSYVPLLRCVHITGEKNDTVSVRYDKPHYVSVNKSLITDITIELKNDQNREIPFSYGKVVVKLDFRPAKQSGF